MQIKPKESLTTSRSVVHSYFSSINRENFETTASLFAEEGILLAPFEKPISGREAIALYLEKEAKKMELIPLKESYETEEEVTQVQVTGKVKTPLFTVNVAWNFDLNASHQITTAKIKLIASPQELLGLQRSKNNQFAEDK